MATPAATFFSSYAGQTPSAYADQLAESMGLNKLANNVSVGWTSALSAAKARCGRVALRGVSIHVQFAAPETSVARTARGSASGRAAARSAPRGEPARC
jgi:hypothetical protein